MKLADENVTWPSVPTSLRVEQSSTPESDEVDVVPELVVESEASGASASEWAPTGTSVIAIAPLPEMPESGNDELDVVVQV